MTETLIISNVLLWLTVLGLAGTVQQMDLARGVHHQRIADPPFDLEHHHRPDEASTPQIRRPCLP